jgi:hypothetical protein
MEKFNRKDQAGNPQAFVGCNGSLTSISEVTKKNSNGKEYYQFGAEVETTTPDNKLKIAGQLYTGLVDHLGGKPKAGDSLSFNTAMADIKEGINTRWNIGGASVDSIDDSLLSAIDSL